MADLDPHYGYAPVSSYAVLGDGRTPLVACDGSIDCFPAAAFDATPASAVFLRDFPQGLSHLALIGAACAPATPLGRDRQPNVMTAQRR